MKADKLSDINFYAALRNITLSSENKMMCITTLLGNVMVQALHLGVVTQQVQALAVGLPQELHPGSEKKAIGTILSVLSTHSAQEHTKIIIKSMSVI